MGEKKRLISTVSACTSFGDSDQKLNPLKELDLDLQNGDLEDLKSKLDLREVEITAGSWVNIPAGNIHGIVSGSEGCEFAWHFACNQWKNIPYLYPSKHIADRNLPPTTVIETKETEEEGANTKKRRIGGD